MGTRILKYLRSILGEDSVSISRVSARITQVLRTENVPKEGFVGAHASQLTSVLIHVASTGVYKNHTSIGVFSEQSLP